MACVPTLQPYNLMALKAWQNATAHRAAGTRHLSPLGRPLPREDWRVVELMGKAYRLAMACSALGSFERHAVPGRKTPIR
jgi:hypothetical protein